MTKLLKIYLYISAFLVTVALLDKFAGKILKVIDPTFRNMLLVKLKKQDVQATKEQVLHIVKPATPNGVVEH